MDSPRAEPSTELLYPVLVEGTTIAHLAVSDLTDAGAGYRAICPLANMITRPLNLIPDGSVFVWCQSCRDYADHIGVTLPRSR